MRRIPQDDPRAVALVQAIQRGDVASLEDQLGEDLDLATARVVDSCGVARTLLHIAADWPGQFPNGARTVALLAAAGADVNAAVGHPEGKGWPETPLHWAASSGDVEVLDALLDAGADIEAPGAVFTGGTALSDAVVFAQWRAARRLLERGAATTIWQAAALGVLDRVRRLCDAKPAPARDALTNALWHACRGGQQAVAEHLVDCGADLNRPGHDGKTPLDVAEANCAPDLARWLRERGAKRSAEIRQGRRDMSSAFDPGLLDALLDAWDRNNAITVNLLHAVPADGFEDRAADGSPSVGEMFAHMHGTRLWLVAEDAPELAGGAKLERVTGADRERLAAMLDDSAQRVKEAVRGRLASGRPMDTHYDHPTLMLHHLIWHEGYHHGQVKLALKRAGRPFDDQAIGPTTWDVWMDKRPQSA